MSDHGVKRFGPMHGERAGRHQFTGRSSHGDQLIVSTYALAEGRLAVEFYRPAESVITSGHLTPQQAGWLRDALDEYIKTRP